MNEGVTFRTIIRATLRRWWLVLPLVGLAGGVAYAVSMEIPEVYRARTSVMVGAHLDKQVVTPENVEVTEHMTTVYADMVAHQPVLQAVVDSLGLDETWQQLGNRVHGELVASNTDLVLISADGSSPQEATRIARATTQALIALSPSGPTNQVRVVDAAWASDTPILPNVEFNVLIAASLGLLVGMAIAYALEFRTRERARASLGLAHLSTSEERAAPE